MSELLDWLSGQSIALSTHDKFQERAAELAAGNPDLAAALYLLIGISERYVAAIDDRPLDLDTAQHARKKLVSLLEQSIRARELEPTARLDQLNALAFDSLIATETKTPPAS